MVGRGCNSFFLPIRNSFRRVNPNDRRQSDTLVNNTSFERSKQRPRVRRRPLTVFGFECGNKGCNGRVGVGNMLRSGVTRYGSNRTLMSEAQTARHVALDLIGAVLRRKRPLDDAIEDSAGMQQLSGRDRAFARLLVATMLRRLGQIDALIADCLNLPLAPRAALVQDVLRLGVAQLLFLRTPPHAAVATSVDIAQSRGFVSHKGLVNAVLRRLSVEGADRVEEQDAPRLNTPDWLWRSWSRTYGEPTARAIAVAHLKEAPLDLTLCDDAETWRAALEGVLLPTGTLRRAAGGARATAIDRSTRRLERLVANLERLDLPVAAVGADALTWRPPRPVEAVLLDAPCSTTGAIRRHPDVPHLKSPEDVARLSAVQENLLRAAIDMLQPGGTLVYCTCSLEPEEGPERIEALLCAGAPIER